MFEPSRRFTTTVELAVISSMLVLVLVTPTIAATTERTFKLDIFNDSPEKICKDFTGMQMKSLEKFIAGLSEKEQKVLTEKLATC